MPTWKDLLQEAQASGGGGNYEPLPNGQYDVKIVKSSHKIAQSGKSMFEVEMQVVSGPHANRRVWNRFVVTPENPKALGYFFSNMRILGLTTEFFAAQPSDDQVAAALENKVCRVELGQSEYNGSVRNEVKKILAAEGAANATASPVASTPASPTVSTPPTAPTTSTAPPTPPF